MRRLCLTLLCGLVAVPAAVAATHATGDGVLEIDSATGTIVITGIRGTAWGQMGKGKMPAIPGMEGLTGAGVPGAPTRAVAPLERRSGAKKRKANKKRSGRR